VCRNLHKNVQSAVACTRGFMLQRLPELELASSNRRIRKDRERSVQSAATRRKTRAQSSSAERGNPDRTRSMGITDMADDGVGHIFRDGQRGRRGG
jgi:hypothetical protein